MNIIQFHKPDSDWMKDVGVCIGHNALTQGENVVTIINVGANLTIYLFMRNLKTSVVFISVEMMCDVNC